MLPESLVFGSWAWCHLVGLVVQAQYGLPSLVVSVCLWDSHLGCCYSSLQVQVSSVSRKVKFLTQHSLFAVSHRLMWRGEFLSVLHCRYVVMV